MTSTRSSAATGLIAGGEEESELEAELDAARNAGIDRRRSPGPAASERRTCRQRIRAPA